MGKLEDSGSLPLKCREWISHPAANSRTHKPHFFFPLGSWKVGLNSPFHHRKRAQSQGTKLRAELSRPSIITCNRCTAVDIPARDTRRIQSSFTFQESDTSSLLHILFGLLKCYYKADPCVIRHYLGKGTMPNMSICRILHVVPSLMTKQIRFVPAKDPSCRIVSPTPR